jgi:hypothetical protein
VFETIIELLIVIPLAYVLSMHLMGPVLVKRSERLPEAYRFTLINEREFFSQRSETFIMLDYEMRTLGFEYVGSSVLSNTNADSFFSLYTKADEALAAMLTTMVNPLGDFSYAEFTRLYEDGSSLEVNNAPISPLFPRRAHKVQLRYPEINTLSRLYETTQRLIATLPNSATPKPLPRAAEFTEVERILNRELEWLVDEGYYARQVVNGFHPMTLKGAVLFSWKSLWPWQQIRQWLDVWRSQRLLVRSV